VALYMTCIQLLQQQQKSNKKKKQKNNNGAHTDDCNDQIHPTAASTYGWNTWKVCHRIPLSPDINDNITESFKRHA
jgi:hypothetical protein